MALDSTELYYALNAVGFGETQSSDYLQIDTYGAKLLKAFVTGLTRIATTQRANDLLTGQKIEVIKNDVCNACAVGTESGPVVLIFRA